MDTTLTLLIYKLVCIGSGLLVCYFGYRLFVLGIFTGAGDLTSQFQSNKLILKKAAPGTFFALFGACVITMSLWKGLEFEGRTPLVASNESKPAAVSEMRAQGFAQTPAARDGANLEAIRAETRAAIFELNDLRARLPADYPKNKLVDLQHALRDSKLALLYSAWGKDWGDYGRFKEWVLDGEPQPPPSGLNATAVEAFHHGEKQ